MCEDQFTDLLDIFKSKSSEIDEMFLHIKYSEILRERFLKANVLTREL